MMGLSLNEDGVGGRGVLTVVPDTDCLGAFFSVHALVIQGEGTVVEVDRSDRRRKAIRVDQDREVLEYYAFDRGDVVWKRGIS